MFGGDFSVTFSKPGTYAYSCVIHPDMKGTVTVT
jgi:plastocyanin